MQVTPTITPKIEEKPSILERPLIGAVTLNWETALFVLFLSLALLTRFIDLGTRVMSHDETSHVYFSWRLYRGMGYQHDPVTHGPLQFHLIALSYFLFGDNDFTARIPAALFSVATIAFMWNYRRYLGRAGAAVAAVLLLISPYILYYGRYARNEASVAFFGVVTLWAILRYLESGEKRYLYWLTGATVLHFTAKETSFIYTAQALIFLGLLFVYRLSQATWPHPEQRKRFLVALALVFLLLAGAATVGVLSQKPGDISATETAAPAVPGQEVPASEVGLSFSPALALVALAGLAFLGALYFLITGYTPDRLRAERSFDLLILLFTLVLPMLAPFPVKALGWNPTDYSTQGMLRTAIFMVPLGLLAIGTGLWWNWRLWLGNVALFYGVFIVLYTTLFTNGAGFFTGLVGSLGYWLEQQGVQRGDQPWYYYILIQVPVYEYLPALGSLLALYLGLRRLPRPTPFDSSAASEGDKDGSESAWPGWRFTVDSSLAVTLLGFWTASSIFAYTYAGEKMPWLTVHIALPLILLASWAIGHLIETTDWKAFLAQRGYLAVALLPVLFLSLLATFSALLGTNPPFQGKELAQLQATSTFLTALLTAIGSGWGLARLVRSWETALIGRVAALTFFGLLGVLTLRTAYMAAYINYDNAKEYLVYAHSAPGSKEILTQVEELSMRTTDGLEMQVAYDDKTTYPFWWYLRNFPNQRYYGANPTRDLRDAPVIIVGSPNYDKIGPVVGQAYYSFEYIRMWWPDQDYFNLTFDRMWNALSDPQWRAAIFQIWFNRDYTQFGQLTNRDMSLPNWSPAEKMRMYIRKDVAAQIWNYGVGPSPEEVIADPYEGKEASLSADLVLGGPGSEPGQLSRPRDLAVAPDGSLYVADTDNHRIQHLARDGSLIHTWGSFGGEDPAAMQPGTFNQPWGIALGPDGSVYVADLWGHRIQKFTPEGEFVKAWGFFGQAEDPYAFWGPRDVAVDAEGRVIVTDTGNKRIVIFDADGNYIAQFGSEGFGPGQFSEPVGLALDQDGNLYVADTWNQRIQVFAPDGAGSFTPVNSWEVFAWYGQSLDNKPYLAVDGQDHIFATDPEGYRILEFTTNGEIVRYWGDFSQGPDGFGLAGAVAADPQGGVWVSDTGNSRLMHFTLP